MLTEVKIGHKQVIGYKIGYRLKTLYPFICYTNSHGVERPSESLRKQDALDNCGIIENNTFLYFGI